MEFSVAILFIKVTFKKGFKQYKIFICKFIFRKTLLHKIILCYHTQIIFLSDS